MTRKVNRAEVNWTVSKVIYLLGERHRLEAWKEQGNDTAFLLLKDLEGIMKSVNLTDKQLQAVELIWVQGYTYYEARDLLGLRSHQVLDERLKLVKKKLREVLDDK